MMIFSHLSYGDTHNFEDFTPYQLITFPDKKSVQYTVDSESITAEVDSGAAFLAKAFAKPELVNRLTFQWQSDAPKELFDLSVKQTKQGDDALIRIGLIIGGKGLLSTPFFAPQWLKALKKLLIHPASYLAYFLPIPGLETESFWQSPYSSRVYNFAIKATKTQDNAWQTSDIKIKPISIVGVMIMADGDDTKTKFTTKIKELHLSYDKLLTAKFELDLLTVFKE